MPKETPTLSAEEILNAEFEYIAQTATQANEDRSSVVSFFVIAVGTPLAAFSSGIDPMKDSILFSVLFFILSVLGITTILQLARLRSAWYESMLAMNHMKEFMIKNSDSAIAGAFRWTAQTAPAKFKLNSISFYQTFQVSILSGVLFGTFVFFLLYSLNLPSQSAIWSISILIGVLFAGFQIYLYRILLK